MPGQTVRFNLVNHNKEDSLFNYGLLPAVYSEVDADNRAFGWRRLGTNACYYQSQSGFEKRRKKAGKVVSWLVLAISGTGLGMSMPLKAKKLPISLTKFQLQSLLVLIAGIFSVI